MDCELVWEVNAFLVELGNACGLDCHAPLQVTCASAEQGMENAFLLEMPVSSAEGFHRDGWENPLGDGRETPCVAAGENLAAGEAIHLFDEQQGISFVEVKEVSVLEMIPSVVSVHLFQCQHLHSPSVELLVSAQQKPPWEVMKLFGVEVM